MNPSLLLIYPKRSESGAIETLPNTEGLKLIEEEFFLRNHQEFLGIQKVCITSEATLDSILDIIKDEEKISAVKSMKDKYRFRKLLSEYYPQLSFEIIEFDAIKELKITNKKVLKPIKGCFGTAVKIIDQNSNLNNVAHEIKTEIDKNSSVLSESVLSQGSFILEDYIKGEEYAVDMFFDSKGKPHIVNIYYHPIPEHKEYLHMIYYTNRSIFEMVFDEAMKFFETLNSKLRLENVALHSEFKYTSGLIPIEINAMRFGGMGLGNMVYHSLNVNPYEMFIKEKSPDWEKIWNQNPDRSFVYFICYNGSQVNKDLEEPDIQKLESKFNHILNKTIFDYKSQLAFGTYTLEESKENLEQLLKIDFNNFFKNIN